MPLELDQEIVRRNESDFKMLDDRNVTGGLHTVNTVAERDAILPALRKAGMLCWVEVVTTMYQLNADLVTWSVYSTTSGSGSGISAAVATATPFNCPITVLVRDVVYVSGADSIDKGDANDPGKQPIAGFVSTKPTTITAVVQYAGELGGFSGLTPGGTYYLSETPGQITDTAPTTTGSVVQRVGVARNTTTLKIEVDRDFVVL